MQPFQVKDLHMWQCFYEVAEKQNFSAAAKGLGLSLPTLSKKVAALERNLQRQLFRRTTRRTSMTEEGRELFPMVKAALEEMNQLEGHLQNEDGEISGIIRMTSFPAFAHRHLVGTFVRFQKKHPKVRFHLHVSDHIIDLVENGIDVAIRSQEPQGADFIYRKLVPNQLILCASPKFLDSLKTPIRSPKDLFEVPVYYISAFRKIKFANVDMRVGDLQRQRMIESETGLLFTELALMGAGIAIRSRWDVQRFINQGKLREVLPKFPLEEMASLYAVTPPGKQISKRIRAFLDFLVQDSKSWLT